MRFVNCIILHHEGSGSSYNLDSQKVVDDIRADHIARGYGDIGYHWLIGRSGKIYKGRSEEIVGAHAYGANTGSIGICMLYGSQDRNVTAESINTLVIEIMRICKQHEFAPTSKSIIGHCDVLATECPGIIYPLIPSIITKCKGFNYNESPILQTSPETAEIRRMKVFSPNGKEYKGILINSQGYVYAQDVAKIAGMKIEWDGKNKILKFKKI